MTEPDQGEGPRRVPRERPGPETIANVLDALPPDEPRPVWADGLTACPPAFATPRDWNYPTMGPVVAAVAAMLGIDLMPWQRYVIDVALEYEWTVIDSVDDKGRPVRLDVPFLRYKSVIGTVPRQSGKTTLGLPVIVHRSIGFPNYGPATLGYGGPQTIVYTAQDRAKARKKWIREYVPAIQACRQLDDLFKLRLANGEEAVQWTNGSYFGIEATTEQAGHGDVLDLAFDDEAFSHIDARLDQAQRPAMITRKNSQQWIWSTMGDDGSIWLNEKVELGRSAVLGRTDPSLRIAYFEFAAPAGSRLDDPDVWATFHPAVGYTQTAADLLSEAGSIKPSSEAERAYFNWRKRGGAVAQVIDSLQWFAAQTDPAHVDIDGRIGIGIDIAPDRSAVFIAWAARTPTEKIHVELDAIRIDDPLDGPPRVAQIFANNPDLCLPRVAVNPSGAAGSLVRALEMVDAETVSLSGRQMASACAHFLDLVRSGKLSHVGQQELDDTIKVAVTRPLGEGFAWAARPLDLADLADRELPTHTSALYAATLAVAALSVDQDPKHKPPTAVARIVE